MIFVDTSGIYAVMLETDPNHETAAAAWGDLRKARERLVTTNYVIVEAASLLQQRHGMTAVKDLYAAIEPLLETHFVGESMHAAAIELFIATNRRKLSLVDCSSFLFMRRANITRAFAFDSHFKDFGFET